MAVSRLVPASTSSEGIVTIKMTSSQTKTTLPVPFPAGNYRVDTGYSGTVAVRLWNGSTKLGEFSFATSSFFNLASTATELEINAPGAAVNGIMSFQLLSRGVAGTTAGWNVLPLVTDQHRYGAIIPNSNGVFIVGGHNSDGWSAVGGTGTIEKWDKSSGTTTVVATNSTALNMGVVAVGVGTDIYWKKKDPAVKTFYKFDTTTNTLTTLAASTFSHGLSAAVANTAGTKIYWFGSYSEPSGNYLKCEVYTIATNTWATIADLPFSGAGYGGVAWNNPANADTLYVSDFVDQTTVQRYNITANNWTSMAAESKTGWYDCQGTLSPTGAYYWRPTQPTTTTDLSTGWFGATAIDGSARYLNLATYPSTMWGLPVIASSGINPVSMNGSSLAKDSTYAYVSCFNSGTDYTGKLFYKAIASSFPASGVGA